MDQVPGRMTTAAASATGVSWQASMDTGFQ